MTGCHDLLPVTTVDAYIYTGLIVTGCHVLLPVTTVDAYVQD